MLLESGAASLSPQRRDTCIPVRAGDRRVQPREGKRVMSDEYGEAPGPAPAGRVAHQRRRPYVAPTLIVYGPIGKLTQSGGVTAKDFGNMKGMSKK